MAKRRAALGRGKASVGAAKFGYTLPSNLFHESGEIRLDASHYSPELVDVRAVLKRSGMRLARVGDVVQDVLLPARFRRVYVEKKDGIPFLQGSHVVHFRPADVKYLAPSSHGDLEAILIREGWLLLTRSGTVGRVTLCPEEWDGWAASEHIIRVVPDEDRCPSGYLCAFIASHFGQVQLNAHVHGAVVDEITDDHVRNVLIPIPTDKGGRAMVGSIDAEMKRAVELKSRAAAAASQSVETTTSWLGTGVGAKKSGRATTPKSAKT